MGEDNFTNKEILVRLMADMREVRDAQLAHTEKLSVIESHTKATNGKLAKAILDIAALEKTMYEEDKRMLNTVLKYGALALVLSAFVFIKESRDFILQILNIV